MDFETGFSFGLIKQGLNVFVSLGYQGISSNGIDLIYQEYISFSS